MNVVVCGSAEQAADFAAQEVCRQVAACGRSTVGWATGGTMERLYQALAMRQRHSPLSWAEVRSFNLDEYLGLPLDHPRSYGYFLRQQVFARLGIQAAHARLLRGDVPDLGQESQDHENAIAAAGGIDFQLLGIGHNGHIGFNEPGASHASRTRVIGLSASTLAANQRFFGPGEVAPRQAITMGIQTILESRRIVLLALGEDKAPAVAAMVEGPLDVQCPASALQTHPATTVVLDPPAARRLVHGQAYRSEPSQAGRP